MSTRSAEASEEAHARITPERVIVRDEWPGVGESRAPCAETSNEITRRDTWFDMVIYFVGGAHSKHFTRRDLFINFVNKETAH